MPQERKGMTRPGCPQGFAWLVVKIKTTAISRMLYHELQAADDRLVSAEEEVVVKT